jgi:AraC family transcriptional regulator
MALPSLVLNQDLLGGTRVRGDLGGGHFDVTSDKGHFYVAPPNVAYKLMVDTRHHTRALAFPIAQWQTVLNGAADVGFSFEDPQLYRGVFRSPAIHSAFRHLWALCDVEGAPSRLLAQAAGCEILAELCRLSGAPLARKRRPCSVGRAALPGTDAGAAVRRR